MQPRCSRGAAEVHPRGAEGPPRLQRGQRDEQTASRRRAHPSLPRLPQVFLLAGDTHGYPVVRLDGEQIGDGRPGPVYAALKRLLLEDAATGSAHHEPLQAGGA